MKIEDAIAHLLTHLLALGVEAERRWRLDLGKENGVLVELHGERRNNVGCITGSPGDVELRGDFERPFNAKKVVQGSRVRSVVGALTVGDLRLVGGQE